MTNEVYQDPVGEIGLQMTIHPVVSLSCSVSKGLLLTANQPINASKLDSQKAKE
jgi:hypothetical protein